MRSTARSRTARSASRIALAIPSGVELPCATTATPRSPSRIAPPTEFGIHAVGAGRRAPGAAGAPPAAASGPERAAAANRVGDGARRALQRLQRDVAGEAVGDDHVGLSREQVAALEVADEADPLGAGERLVGLDHVGAALLLLLADREQGDAGALDAEHRRS